MSAPHTTMSVPRRRLLALGAVLGLSACGFELRKAPDFDFKTMVVQGNSAFVNQVRRNLRGAGNVTVLPVEQKANADVIFEVLGEDRERIVVSTNSAGLVREVQLRLRIRFRLTDPAGKELLPASSIEQTRDLSFNETNVLAKEAEADLLYRDMQNDIAQQILRRLAAVKL